MFHDPQRNRHSVNEDPGDTASDYVLRTTLTSPYGRKVRIAADLLGLTHRITIVPADTLDEADTLRLQNPLGKMPCLLLPEGSAIYDSAIIVEFFQEVAGNTMLLPWHGPDRFSRLTETRLADGITDATLLMVYERRFRTEEHVSQRWLNHQQGKIERGLAFFEKAPPQGTTMIAVCLACALGYLDWRRPYAWRPHFPELVRWLNHFASAVSAFHKTDPLAITGEVQHVPAS
jgi:glutathione S-transferase